MDECFWINAAQWCAWQKKNPKKVHPLNSLPHSHSLPGLQPWYNHAGWLDIKHQVTYCWAPFNSLASVNGRVLLLFPGALDTSTDTRVDCYHRFVAVICTRCWPQGMFPHGKAGSYSSIPTPKQYQHAWSGNQNLGTTTSALRDTYSCSFFKKIFFNQYCLFTELFTFSLFLHTLPELYKQGKYKTLNLPEQTPSQLCIPSFFEWMSPNKDLSP